MCHRNTLPRPPPSPPALGSCRPGEADIAHLVPASSMCPCLSPTASQEELGQSSSHTAKLTQEDGTSAPCSYKGGWEWPWGSSYSPGPIAKSGLLPAPACLPCPSSLASWLRNRTPRPGHIASHRMRIETQPGPSSCPALTTLW